MAGAKNFVLLFCIIFVATTNGLTHVTVYERTNYGGGSVSLPNLENYSYYYFTSFNNKMSSFQINRGSCVEMYVDNPPGTTGFWAKDPNFPSVGEWNNRISTVKACGSYRRTLHCPQGTFVKKIEWNQADLLTKGIKLFCYRPDSKTTSTTLLTHPNQNFRGSELMCTGIRGISYSRSPIRECDIGLTPQCTPGNSEGNKIMCGRNAAVSGMAVTIENRSNYIKSSTLYCSDAGDIEAICRAEDEKQTLFTCDATGAVGPLKCTWEKKVGYGKRSALSEAHSNEFTFYSEFGFELGAAGYGLSANFKGTIGQSNKTGYNWESSQESTWSTEITFTIEIEAPPGCRTTVSEIVGECSFISVRPYHFERNDTCRDFTHVTQEIIPANIANQIYKSPIPAIFTTKVEEAMAVPIVKEKYKGIEDLFDSLPELRP